MPTASSVPTPHTHHPRSTRRTPRTPRTHATPWLCLAVLLACAASTPAQTTHIVTVSGLNFSPKNLTITAGDSVQWTNLQSGGHSVTQTNCPATSTSLWNGGFRSGNGGAVNTFTVLFPVPESVCYICEPHVVFGMNGTVTVLPNPNPWIDLGGGLAGIAGLPTLDATGPLTPGSNLSIDLVQAPPNAFILFWMSFTSVPFGFWGGTVHATPPNLQVLTMSNGAGSFSQSVVWPAGVPVGTDIYIQFLVQDLSTLHEITLSNALHATTP